MKNLNPDWKTVLGIRVVSRLLDGSNRATHKRETPDCRSRSRGDDSFIPPTR